MGSGGPAHPQAFEVCPGPRSNDLRDSIAKVDRPSGRPQCVEIRNDKLLEDFKAGRAIRLNIGSGPVRRDDTYNLDIRDLPGTDLLADLEAPLDRLPDASVEHVEAHHVLEHVSALDELLDELHRVLVPDGSIDIRVPHWANPLGYSDPTHVRLFGLYSFCYLVPLQEQPLGRKVPNYRSRRPFDIETLELCFRRNNRLFQVLESFLNADHRRLEAYEKNLANTIWPYEVHCVLKKATGELE